MMLYSCIRVAEMGVKGLKITPGPECDVCLAQSWKMSTDYEI